MKFVLKFYNFLEAKWLDNLKKFKQFHKIFGAIARVLLPKKPGCVSYKSHCVSNQAQQLANPFICNF